MSKDFERNRYLSLDGQPMEQGFIRRTIAPKGLSISFLVAVGCMTTSLDELKDVGVFIGPAIMTFGGCLQRRAVSLGWSFGFWQLDINRYAVDMKPSAGQSHNPPDFYDLRAIGSTSMTALTAIGCLYNSGGILNGSGVGMIEHLEHEWTTDVPFLFPLFHQAAQQAHTYHKVKTGDWKIIKVSEMEKTLPKTEPEPLLQCMTEGQIHSPLPS